MKVEYYKASKTIWKFVKATGVFAGGAGATIVFPEADAPWYQWVIFLALCTPPVLTALVNFWKHRDKVGGKFVYVVLFAAVLGGCASNGITVREITSADGSSLIVEQKTISTWGSKTEEGAGSFHYVGSSPDSSSFDMQAGASVIGQVSQDPAASLASLVHIFETLTRLVYAAPAPSTSLQTLDLEGRLQLQDP